MQQENKKEEQSRVAAPTSREENHKAQTKKKRAKREGHRYTAPSSSAHSNIGRVKAREKEGAGREEPGAQSGEPLHTHPHTCDTAPLRPSVFSVLRRTPPPSEKKMKKKKICRRRGLDRHTRIRGRSGEGTRPLFLLPSCRTIPATFGDARRGKKGREGGRGREDAWRTERENTKAEEHKM